MTPAEDSLGSELEECKRTRARLRLLSDASVALSASFDYRACLARVGELVVPALADWCVLHVFEGGRLKPVVFAHTDPAKSGLLREIHEKRPGDLNGAQPETAAFRSGKPLIVSDARDSLIAVPLVAPERTLGSLVMGRSRNGKRYDEGDLEIAEELARRIAQALDNAMLHRALNEAMQQRVERDQFLRMTFQQLPGVVWTTDRDLRLSYVAGRPANDAKPRPTPGMSLFDFLGTRDPAEPLIAHHFAALSGERHTFEYRYGGRWLAIFLEPLQDRRGRIAGCVGAAFDITEQRATRERLARSEARLAEAQRVAHVGSFEWDIGRNEVTWSDELHRIYGMQPGQFAGTYDAFLCRVHPDDVERTKGIVFDALLNMKAFAYEHRIVRSDGSVRVLHTSGDVASGESGKPARLVGTCWDVTENVEAVHNLKHARSLLEATIEATADGLLVVDRGGGVTAYNQRFLSCWRIPLELARERDDDKLLAFVMDQLEDPEGFVRGVRDLYRHPDRESFDVLRLKDGRVFERYSRPQCVGGEIVGRVWSFHDVTERERLYRRALFLADATRLMASLDVEPALDSVAHLAVPFIGDECAIDLLGNGGPRRLLVVSRDPAQPINAELHTAVLSGHPILYTAGTRSCMAVPLMGKDSVIGAITFIASNSRKYTPDDLELAEDLASRAALAVENAHLYRSTQEALHARDELFSIAAHEIRGPLTSIHLAVQSMQKGKAAHGVQARVLEMIEREDRRLARFVDELLDLGAIRSGRVHFTFEEVDLGDVVREAASRLGGEMAKTGASLTITTEGRPVGQWDRFRLDQVVTNLLANAIKFGLGKPIAVAVREQDGVTTLIVKDEGVGIPPEMLERVFDPFERAVSARHYGGLGLGLFIVRTIVQGLGGNVHVDSRPHAGSTFTITLPREANS